MALRLKCTICGANIIADDLAVRHELATCSHCSTVLRITQKGMKEYKASILAREEPSGIRVKRGGPGKLSISALRTQSAAAVINYRELVKGTKIGVAVAAGIGVVSAVISLLLTIFLPSASIDLPNPISLFFCIVLPAVIISIFVVGMMHKSLPPLRLEGDLIHPSVLGTGQVATKNVQQIYTAVTNVLTGSGDKSVVSCMVYALTQDGDRFPLIGPLDSQEAALYIEEILEVEIGIFNLPVYGDVDLPGQEGHVLPESPEMTPIKGLQCQSCAAELSETPEARRRGFLVCDYCEVVMLLYEPDTSKPILGVPDPNSPTFQYRIEATPDGLAIFARHSDTFPELIRVLQGQLHLTRPDGSVRTIETSRIIDFQVKETAVAQGGKVDRSMLSGIVKTFGTAMAHSGDVDPQKVLRQAIGLTAFKVVAKTVDGREDSLLDNIRDPQEAFLLVESLKKTFN